MQGSVATRLRCGGIVNDRYIANFLEIVTVKEFLKLANIDEVMCSIWGSLFWSTLYVWILCPRTFTRAGSAP